MKRWIAWSGVLVFVGVGFAFSRVAELPRGGVRFTDDGRDGIRAEGGMGHGTP